MISKAESRRRYAEADKLIADGMVVKEACKRLGIGVSNYYTRQKKARLASSPVRHQVVPVLPLDDFDGDTANGAFSITLSGAPKQIGEFFRSMRA